MTADISRHRSTRRNTLRLMLAGGGGLLGLALSACAGGPAALTTTPTTPTSARAPATMPSGSADWDQLVAAAQAEGKVVVSGSPAPAARTTLPSAFKNRFNIELEYLAGNTSQLASRVESERAAGEYTLDVSLSGADTVYASFVPNGWLEPIKPTLVLPDVLDPGVWPNGSPWFRDPSGTTVMQILNTVGPIGYLNTRSFSADEIKASTDLLKSTVKGRIASYDPGVNGAGLNFGSVVYVTLGADFARQLYAGQQVALTRDSQQIADWLAHDSYPIALGAYPEYIAPYKDAAPLQQLVLSDVKPIVQGGFGLVSLWNHAPHPNAARVFVNWIASREGSSVFAPIAAAAPVRTDIDASAWLAPELLPKPGHDYFDVYDYQYVVQQRQPIARFYASVTGT